MKNKITIVLLSGILSIFSIHTKAVEINYRCVNNLEPPAKPIVFTEYNTEREFLLKVRKYNVSVNKLRDCTNSYLESVNQEMTRLQELGKNAIEMAQKYNYLSEEEDTLGEEKKIINKKDNK